MHVSIITPVVLSPEKEHFAGAMRALSGTMSGDVFTSSNRFHDGHKSSRFLLFATLNRRTLAWRIRRFLLQVLGPLRRHGARPYDAVIAHDPYAAGIAAVLVAFLLRIKCIIELNGDYHEVAPRARTLEGRLMRWAMRVSLSRADAVRVLNQSQAQYVRTHYPRAAVFKFAEYAALSVFESTPRRPRSYILSVGFPFALKGMDVLIAAFLKIADRFPHVGLRIMGYAPPADLAAFKAFAGGHPRIEFIPPGWINDVANQMAGAIALVNAGRTEAFGRVHVEAMALALPVIASRTNGAAEIVVEGETGFLFDIGDAQSLAELLSRVLSEPTLAKRLGEAGQRRVHEHYSEQAYGRNVTAMLEAVCRST